MNIKAPSIKKTAIKYIMLGLLVFFLDAFVFKAGGFTVLSAAALIVFVIFYFIFIIFIYIMPKSWLPEGLLKFRDKERIKRKTYEFATYIIIITALFFSVVKVNRSRIAGTEKAVQTIIVAVDKYNVKCHHYPDKLEKLVPDFLPEIPKTSIKIYYFNTRYNSGAVSTSLWYAVAPPYGRKIYNFENKSWHYLD